MAQQQPKRFMELEGLRGLAAIVVAIYHFALAFYLLAYFGPRLANPAQHMAIESFLYANPLGGLISGTFAVAIFFTLSGFVLSIGFFQTGQTDILRKLAAKRYLRLMLPALASVLLCYILMKIGLNNTQAAAGITGSTWLANNWAFAPHLLVAAKQGSMDIFTAIILPNSAPYNNVLWTMTWEFVGSFIVFIGLLLFGASRFRWLMYAFLLIVTFNTWLLGFIIGMILADLYNRKLLIEKKRNIMLAALLLIIGIYLGGYPFDGPDLTGTAYGWISLLKVDIHHQMLAVTVGAAIVVGAVLATAQFAGFLRQKRLSVIGKYTFSLYLIHLPILYSVTAGIFLALHRVLGYNKAVALAVLASVPIVWGMTVLFEKYIDAKSVTFASYCADIYFGKRPLGVYPVLLRWKQYIIQRRTTIRARFVIRSSTVVVPEFEEETE